jgi:hypothetical protein
MSLLKVKGTGTILQYDRMESDSRDDSRYFCGSRILNARDCVLPWFFTKSLTPNETFTLERILNQPMSARCGGMIVWKDKTLTPIGDVFSTLLSYREALDLCLAKEIDGMYVTKDKIITPTCEIPRKALEAWQQLQS